jgi:membrane protease YdiL (CAAX protease family)
MEADSPTPSLVFSSRSPRSAEEGPPTAGFFHRPVHPIKPRQKRSFEVPDRYVIREDETGPYLSCLEAPELMVRIDRNLSLTAGAARKAAEGTIFLDGVAQSEPFLDLERRVYNLDHHEGCVRHFTLSTCEQALVLVARGLDVREKPWQVLANEPDLDVVLAIWVLSNSMHLQGENSTIRDAVIPLVRLEGLIDSHGLELSELSGYPRQMVDELSGSLDTLRETELKLKEEGGWGGADLLKYLRDQLRLMDQMIYPADFFEAFRGIDELAKTELTDNRIAVVCRCDCGIYELEKELKRLYGKRLGVIGLQKRPGVYTLRQVDPFLPVDLNEAYRKLNVLDPAVQGGGSSNRWGGSGEIGGSPRKTGTSLSPVDIAEAVKLAYRRPGVWDRSRSIALAVVLSSVPLVAGWLVVMWHQVVEEPRTLFGDRLLEFLAVSSAVAIGGLLVMGRRGRRRFFGLQWPEGRGWIWMAPVVTIGGLLGGIWLFLQSWLQAGRLSFLGPAQLLALVGFPLLAEIVFRGVAHGVMVHDFSVQHARGRWFVSWPVVIATLLFVIWTLILRPLAVTELWWPDWSAWILPLGAIVSGVALGMARERSGSLLASLGLHYLAVVIAIVFVSLLR